MTVRHKRFGRVYACQAHDPAKADLALPIVDAPSLPPADDQEQAPTPDQAPDQASELELYRNMFRQFLKLTPNGNNHHQADDDQDGGSKDRRPTAPTKPTPPGAGAQFNRDVF